MSGSVQASASCASIGAGTSRVADSATHAFNAISM